MGRLVYGIGINDADYKVAIVEEIPSVNGKRKQKELWRCPFYSTWKSMIERCYSEREKERNKSVYNSSCCNEWLLFSNFKKWMEQQNWENKILDKDLLVYKNTLYSPSTCYFIDKSLSSFLIDNFTGNYLPGVSYINGQRKKKYIARIYNEKQISLGVYLTELEAHRKWQEAKIEIFKKVLSKQSDEVIINALNMHLSMIVDDYNNHRVTKNI